MRTNCTERFGQQETKAFFVQNNTVFVGHILRKKKKKTLAICNQVTALKKAGKKPKSKFKITVAYHQFNFHQISFLTYSK